MKRFLFGTLATVGLFGLASCSSDDTPDLTGNGVTFKISLPGDMTRGSFGDGSDAGDRADLNTLKYTVYEVDPATNVKNIVHYGTKEAFPGDQNSSETITLQLVNGRQYQVAFYADDSSNAFCSFDETTGKMNVDYSGAASNVAAQDAFVGRSSVFAVNGAYSESVTLERPFAQLNWGTNDKSNPLVEGKLDGTSATVTIKQNCLYNTLDVLTDEVDDIVDTEVVFAAIDFGNLPEQAFPVVSDDSDNPNVLIAMNYLLTGKGTVDCELDITGNIANKIIVNSAPVNANYRTNIYGALLTSANNFDITVDNDFSGDNDVELVVREPAKGINGEYLVTTEGELRWVAKTVNAGGADSQANTATYSLQNDIYLTSPWTPIGTGFNNRFSGKFNGNGHTIYNMVVNSNDRTGFFGMMNGQVENLNFENATVTSNHWAGVVAGYSDNETGSTFIRNCTVRNSSVTLACEQIDGNWDNGDKGGLIIGFMASRDQVESCAVINCTLRGYRDLGGIIGYASGSVIRNNTVEGLTITVDKTHDYKNYGDDNTKYDANSVIGEKTTSATDEGNQSAEVSINY